MLIDFIDAIFVASMVYPAIISDKETEADYDNGQLHLMDFDDIIEDKIAVTQRVFEVNTNLVNFRTG